jgi:hypothetical protein
MAYVSCCCFSTAIDNFQSHSVTLSAEEFEPLRDAAHNALQVTHCLVVVPVLTKAVNGISLVNISRILQPAPAA